MLFTNFTLVNGENPFGNCHTNTKTLSNASMKALVWVLSGRWYLQFSLHATRN